MNNQEIDRFVFKQKLINIVSPTNTWGVGYTGNLGFSEKTKYANEDICWEWSKYFNDFFGSEPEGFKVMSNLFVHQQCPRINKCAWEKYILPLRKAGWIHKKRANIHWDRVIDVRCADFRIFSLDDILVKKLFFVNMLLNGVHGYSFLINFNLELAIYTHDDQGYGVCCGANSHVRARGIEFLKFLGKKDNIIIKIR